MAKVKTVNYTDEMVATLKAGYTGTDNATEVAALSEAVKRSKASVIAKLDNLGVYIVAEKAGKARGAKKSEVVAGIAKFVGMNELEQEGMLKSTATPLAKVLARLTADAATIEALTADEVATEIAPEGETE